MDAPPPISASPTKTSPLAITSLVLGIVSVVFMVICLGLVFAIPAIICGHMAVSRIKRSGGALSGKGMAIAGFVTGYVCLALTLLIVPLAIPNFVKARKIAQMNACVANLRLLDAAKHQLASEKGANAPSNPTQDDLMPFLGRGGAVKFPVCPAGGTYQIGAMNEPPTCTIADHVISK